MRVWPVMDFSSRVGLGMVADPPNVLHPGNARSAPFFRAGGRADFAGCGPAAWEGGPAACLAGMDRDILTSGWAAQEQPLVVPQSSQTTQVPLRRTRTEPQEEQLSPA